MFIVAVVILVVAVVGAGFATDWFGLSAAKSFSGTATLQLTTQDVRSYPVEKMVWNAIDGEASVARNDSVYTSTDGTRCSEGNAAWYEVTNEDEDGWMILPSQVSESGPVGIWALADVQTNHPAFPADKYVWTITCLKIEQDGSCLIFHKWELADTFDEAKGQISDVLSTDGATSNKGYGSILHGTWEKTSDNVVRMTFDSGDEVLGYSLTLTR